jgi:hypothetical protein
MRKLTNYLFISLIVFTLSSCKINVGDGDDDNGNGNNNNFIVLDQPQDNSINVSPTPMLSWHYNSSSQGLTFSVYLDTFSQPNTMVASNVPPNNYQVTTPLAVNKTYYWFIETTFEGKTYQSVIWKFTTMNQTLFSNPQPPDSATQVSLTPQLSWQYNSYYDYFEILMDTINPPNFYITTVNTPSYQISNPLKNNTKYYWKILVHSQGGTIQGNVWRFTTLNNIPTNGLVAYYPFNGNTNDESGKGNNGINYGATLTYDRFNNYNNAYYFNGINYFISVNNSSSFQPSSGLSISAWINLSYPLKNEIIAAKGTETTINSWALGYDSVTAKVYFQINLNGELKKVFMNSALMTYNWNNIICTFDGSIMSIYFNGQQENLLPTSYNMGTNNEDFRIGSNSAGYYFYGSIDDIRIYNRTLNESEIQQLYHEGGWTKK